MRDVWRLPAIAPWEKSCGKYPTQKNIVRSVEDYSSIHPVRRMDIRPIYQ